MHGDFVKSWTGKLNRREMLRLMVSGAAASVIGCARSEISSAGDAGASKKSSEAGANPPCVVRPEQIEGPYFVDTKLNRSDIRSDPADGSVSPGVPLRLSLRVSRISGGSCTPLPGAIVDIWQCDAKGAYSDFEDRIGGFDTRGKKFLRGFQKTNGTGQADFTTIYPGWYPGRTVHVHFKIRTNPDGRQGSEFTSQLYFDDLITDQVHMQAPYNSRGQRGQRNERDGIFREGGKDLMLQLKKDGEGYNGIFEIGLELA